MKQISLAFLVFGVLVSACATATVEPLKIQSGKPYVTFVNVPKKKVVDALTNRMLSMGYQIKSISDNNAIYWKRFESSHYYSREGGHPEQRINYEIVEFENIIKIVATVEIVANPGTAYENVYSTSESAHDIQNMLEELKVSMNKNK